MMMPNYMQIRGIARGARRHRACRGRWSRRRRRMRAGADLEALEALVSPATKLIVDLQSEQSDRRAADAERGRTRSAGSPAGVGAGCVRRDLSRRGTRQRRDADIWGRYDRALVTSGLSKAYGLPGLRIGWVVGPPALVEDTVGRPRLHVDRARRAERPARAGRAGAAATASSRGPAASSRRTTRWSKMDRKAGTGSDPRRRRRPARSCFVRYRQPINSTALVERLRDEKSVLLVPGDHFDMDGYLRIGFGNHPAYVASALELVGERAGRPRVIAPMRARPRAHRVRQRRAAVRHAARGAARTADRAMTGSTAASSGSRRGATAERSTGTASTARSVQDIGPGQSAARRSPP